MYKIIEMTEYADPTSDQWVTEIVLDDEGKDCKIVLDSQDLIDHMMQWIPSIASLYQKNVFDSPSYQMIAAMVKSRDDSV